MIDGRCRVAIYPSLTSQINSATDAGTRVLLAAEEPIETGEYMELSLSDEGRVHVITTGDVDAVTVVANEKRVSILVEDGGLHIKQSSSV